eukprot:scaffold18681_cov63-Phaeocystis_antarctica.AAC.3
MTMDTKSATEGLPKPVLGAAVEGDAQAVAAWLDEGGGVDARLADHSRETLLMAAAGGGHVATVRMLLQRGASVNLRSSYGGTALMDAADGGHTTIVQALLDAKADASVQAMNGSTALMAAEEEKHTATAQLLRQHAKRKGAEAEAKAATTAEVGLPVAAWRAAAEGDAQAVAAWLDEGGGVDACSAEHSVTLLMGATFGGQEAIVRMLLQRGASVNLQNSGGTTALMAAAASGHTTI